MEKLYIIILALVFIGTIFLEKRRVSYALINSVSVFFIITRRNITISLVVCLILIILNFILINLSRKILAFQVKPFSILDKSIYLLCFIFCSYNYFINTTGNIIIGLIGLVIITVLMGFLINDLLNSYVLTWITYLFGKEIIYRNVKLEFYMRKVSGKYTYKIYRAKLDRIEGEFNPSSKLLKRYAHNILDVDSTYEKAKAKTVKVKMSPIFKRIMILEIT